MNIRLSNTWIFFIRLMGVWWSQILPLCRMNEFARNANSMIFTNNLLMGYIFAICVKLLQQHFWYSHQYENWCCWWVTMHFPCQNTLLISLVETPRKKIYAKIFQWKNAYDWIPWRFESFWYFPLESNWGTC